MIYKLLRRALFTTPPELAHELALESLKLSHTVGASRLLGGGAKLPVSCMGLEFDNPVGLAAGMDKNGDYIDALGSLGFGFLEIGTVTPKPQPGNPKPRVFRIPEAQAMINRLGFNNKGVDHLVRQAERRRYPGILGINIGKNKSTLGDQALQDYLYCLERVYPVADYVTVNISSPNTPGLRDLQSPAQLDQLLAALDQRRMELAEHHERRLPLAVKVAPDLKPLDISQMAEVIARHQFDAVICTNTTISRDGVESLSYAEEAGGLSGAPLQQRSNATLKRFRKALPEAIALIGVGGIMSGQDAVDKIKAGADLIQFYTGFVYHGPDLVKHSIRAIARHQAG